MSSITNFDVEYYSGVGNDFVIVLTSDEARRGGSIYSYTWDDSEPTVFSEQTSIVDKIELSATGSLFSITEKRLDRSQAASSTEAFRSSNYVLQQYD